MQEFIMSLVDTISAFLTSLDIEQLIKSIVAVFPALLVIFALVKIVTSGLRLVEKVLSVLLTIGLGYLVLTSIFGVII